MPNGIAALILSAAAQVGMPGPSETPNFPPLQNAYNQYGFEGQYEQRFPFDTQQNWVHGYFQEIPAYGGHPFFRPYNYKDVLSQSQVSAGWGQSPVLPYSQQFWHKYHDRATMLKLSQSEGAPGYDPAAAMPAPPMVSNAVGVRRPAPNYPVTRGVPGPVWSRPYPGQVEAVPAQGIPAEYQPPVDNGPTLQPVAGQETPPAGITLPPLR